MYADTIAAIATPPGLGALGIVRLSGGDAPAIARRVFNRRLRDHVAVHGRLRDPADGGVVDEAVATWFAAPRSYTREDVVELCCHGGPVALQAVLQLLLRSGARAAEPGEFTLRAFLNGRIDLAEAEAVMDVVQARTGVALAVAQRGLAGGLSARVRALRAALLEPLAYLTALNDFPDDEVGAHEVAGPLTAAVADLERLILEGRRGQVYREGVRAVLAGRPNVGKSSLLNRLLGHDRSIVTDIPGTTRDTIEETANLGGIPVVLTDTAGIIETSDPVERLGVARSRFALAAAELTVLVLDGSCPLTPDDLAMVAGLDDGRSVVVVVNKTDLPPAPWAAAGEASLPGHWPVVRVSAHTGAGTGELVATLVALATGGPAQEPAVATNQRQQGALERARTHLVAASTAYGAGSPGDLVTIDLSAALAALGEVTGETVTEGLLDAVFSRFCIGK